MTSAIIIGAGILGASFACRLAREGVAVTVIDAACVGGVASAASFGWINASHGNPRSYYDLRLHSMAEWAVLKAAMPELPYRRNGTIYVDYDVPAEQHLAEHAAWGYALEPVDASGLAALEPRLKAGPALSVRAPEEAALQVDAAARVLTQAARAAGATVIENRAVTGLVRDGNRITGVRTAQGDLVADEVVLTAGIQTAALVSDIGLSLPLAAPQGLLVKTKPVAPMIRHTLLTDGLHIQQRPDGSLLAGADFGGGSINDDPEAGAAEIIRRIRSAFTGTQDVALAGITLGQRPTPEDGFPVVGRADGLTGLYIAVMHSGATLAAGVSRLGTQEILGEGPADLLTPFRLSRFTGK